MARLESGAGLGESRSAAGISTSTEPTLYGPVYDGKAGVGLKRENHDILSLDQTRGLLCSELAGSYARQCDENGRDKNSIWK